MHNQHQRQLQDDLTVIGHSFHASSQTNGSTNWNVSIEFLRKRQGTSWVPKGPGTKPLPSMKFAGLPFVIAGDFDVRSPIMAVAQRVCLHNHTGHNQHYQGSALNGTNMPSDSNSIVFSTFTFTAATASPNHVDTGNSRGRARDA